MRTTNFLIDTHAHLDAAAFADDQLAIVQRATDAGVGAIVNVGYNAATWPTTCVLADRYPGISACIGLHPNDASAWTDALIATLAALHAHPKVVAVGETGLDYYRAYAPPTLQRAAFVAQLALARSLSKPVVIHHREAREDLLAILRDDRDAHGPLHGVLHAFNGDATFATELLDLGLHLGIGGLVTFKNAVALHDAVRAIPVERILIETDSPYLAPHPHRGRRNEPSFVALVAARIAEITGVDVDEIAATTTANAERFFGLAATTGLTE